MSSIAKKSHFDFPDFDDRQAGMLIVFLGVFAVAIPVVTLVLCGITAGWMSALGAHDVHGRVFGFLSNHDGPPGQQYWQPGGIIPLYFTSVFTFYGLYQVCEGVNWLFQEFKRALS